MNKDTLIPVKHFKEAFQRVGWKEDISESGEYLIWTDPKDSQVWTRLPLALHAPDYRTYQDKNVLMLLYALDIPESEPAARDLLSQLKSYNYKLINRIVGSKSSKSDAVPYELASVVPEKNISAFRYFYQTKQKNKSLPIERFQFNHTEVGSFVIPVSILVDDKPNTTLMPIASDTNMVLHQYLGAVDTLAHMPRNNPKDFADRIIDESIDSKIVRDFLGQDSSIARYREKYTEEVSGITIGGTGSALLDFGLTDNERTFKEVDLGGVKALKEDYLDMLVKIEIESDDTKLEAHEVRLDVVVEAIDINGHVKFTVTSIDNTELKKPFKAVSADLPKAKLDQFADMFKDSGAATISGDVFKSKGKIGKVVVDTLGEHSSKEESNLKLV